jgi:hypothetical protein
VQALASQLASQLDAYAARLEEADLKQALSDAACSTNPVGAFERGILAPLARLPAPAGGPYYLLLDALDEALAGRDDGPSLVTLLAPRLERLPGWLRLIATSRPEHEVRRRLGAVRVEPIHSGGRENEQDLDAYLGARLQTPELASRLAASGRPADAVRHELAASAAGNFLYAQQVLLGVERDVFRFDNLVALPPGLAGIYDAFFERLFPDAASYAPSRRVLEVVVAAGQPLTGEQIARTAGLEPDYELPRMLRLLASYLPERDGTYALYHRSLAEWLADSNGKFHASPRGGHQALGEAGWREYERGVAAMSTYMLQHHDHHLAEGGQSKRRERLQSDLVYLDACGKLYLRIGNVGRAGAVYEQAVRHCRRLAASDPGNAEWQRDLSVSHNKLGDVRRAQGDLAGAEAAYADSLEIARRLAASDPGNAQWQRDLVVSYYKLAALHDQAGDTEVNERFLRLCWEVLCRMRLAQMHLDPPMAGLLDTLDRRFAN